jgi:hypothetical protein
LSNVLSIAFLPIWAHVTWAAALFGPLLIFLPLVGRKAALPSLGQCWVFGWGGRPRRWPIYVSRFSKKKNHRRFPPFYLLIGKVHYISLKYRCTLIFLSNFKIRCLTS